MASLERRGQAVSGGEQTEFAAHQSDGQIPERPAAVSNQTVAGLQAMLRVEEDARRAHTMKELQYLISNETRKLTQARQVFVFTKGRVQRITNISGLPVVDRAAPLVESIEAVVASLSSDVGLEKEYKFKLPDKAGDDNNDLQNYPFPALLWQPLKIRGNHLVGGLLLAREQEWRDADDVVVARLAGVYAHAWGFLINERGWTGRLAQRLLASRKLASALAVALLLALAIPVPMTTLAPFEIVARDPFVVAAPLDGVIEEILVEPGSEIRAEQLLVRFASTILKNKLDVAQREVLVAEAGLKKASQLAFDDVRGRHELRLSMAEHALKMAEFDFARDMFNRATVVAQRSGVALYADKQSLIGKPVALGERIMQIADPGNSQVALDVPISDAIVLKSGASVKVFLDSDPIHPRQGKIKFANYQAHANPGGQLAFRVVAELAPSEYAPPRLGERGTAQVYGKRVLLAEYLFRRPLSALRQWLGL